jgi:hypothetical protein
MVWSDVQYIPPYSLLSKWMARHAVPGTTRLTPLYDDVLDVLKGLLQPIPVDAGWYQAEYPAIEDYLARSPAETPKSHFRKHGYFEGRRPFAPGWLGLTDPFPFARVQTRLPIIPAQGRLQVDIERNDFLGIVTDVLMAVPVDQSWYRATYPDAAHEMLPSAARYYATRGYFKGHLPFDMSVEPDWYISRYEHVRNALSRGVVKSAQDHFHHSGYQEGCRPAPP